MSAPTITRIDQCRACGGKQLQQFLNFPAMPFTDDFVKPENKGSEFCADIPVYICRDCLSAQTQHNVDVGDYYEDYQYSVGASGKASVFMRLLAENLQSKYYPGKQGVKVLEIGSGDGEQLLAFKKTGCSVLGYEPSSLLCKVAGEKGIPSIQGLFDENSVAALPADFQSIDVIMLSYTFDHLPKPQPFLASCLRLLNAKDGLLVIEIHDLEKIIERQEYCLFEHEHSIYLTEQTAHTLFEREGYAIIDFDLVPDEDRRANSLIIVATPKTSERARQAVLPRTPQKFQELEFYAETGQQIAAGIAHLEAFIAKATAAGKKLAGYGAGGRGVMTLAAVKNAGSLEFLVDRKPKEVGLLVPKSHIPLVDIAYLAAHPVDAILVFSYGYMAEIQKELIPLGYEPSQFYSLLDVLSGSQ
jgi:SAM-dependent methyltransferase